MVIDFNNLADNPHKLLFDLRDATQVQKINDYLYMRVAFKGEFNLFDYDCGTYYIRLSLSNNDWSRSKDEPILYCVHFCVGCADDGGWGAWGQPTTKEKAKELLDKIATELLPELTIMPSEEDLNKMLAPYKLWGQYDG